MELWAPSLGQLFCSGLFDAYNVPTAISRPRNRRQFHFGKDSTQKLLPLWRESFHIPGKLASLTAAFTQSFKIFFLAGTKREFPSEKEWPMTVVAHPARSGSQSKLKLNLLHLGR